MINNSNLVYRNAFKYGIMRYITFHGHEAVPAGTLCPTLKERYPLSGFTSMLPEFTHSSLDHSGTVMKKPQNFKFQSHIKIYF